MHGEIIQETTTMSYVVHMHFPDVVSGVYQALHLVQSQQHLDIGQHLPNMNRILVNIYYQDLILESITSLNVSRNHCVGTQQK